MSKHGVYILIDPNHMLSSVELKTKKGSMLCLEDSFNIAI